MTIHESFNQSRQTMFYFIFKIYTRTKISNSLTLTFGYFGFRRKNDR